MITLQRIQKEDKQLLYNLLQKYLYELTAFYDIEMDKNGEYEYSYFEEYFTDCTRDAFLIRQDVKIAGFVLLNQHSNIGTANLDHNIAEFCVLPKYRGAHVAGRTLELLLAMYPGKWEIKFNKNNVPACRLWMEVARGYETQIYELEDEERVLVFNTNRCK